jgi:hypothetical protein
MKENIYQPKLAVRHSMPCFAVLSLQLHEALLLQTARIIRSTICKYIRSIENQSFSAPFFWRYPFLFVYKGLTYFRGMFDAMLMKFNPPLCTMLVVFRASYSQWQDDNNAKMT